MKRLSGFLLLLCFAFLFSSSAFAQTFEGAITMEITSSRMQQPMTMVISTKGDKSVAEMSMPQGSMKTYIDQSAGTITTVMGTMGMQMPLKKVQDMAHQKTAEVPQTNIVQTGQKKVINGHSCELYIVTSKDSSKSNWWMTDDLPKSLLNSLRGIYNNSAGAGIGGRSGGLGAAAIGEMFKKGLVPIRVEMLKDGKPETTMTFVSYEQKHLDDSEFTIPSNVKVEAMPGMGGE